MAKTAPRPEPTGDGGDGPSPRSAIDFLGHEGAENDLIEAFRSGRMPRAWLIEGPKGIGKATLAYRFARFLLTRRRVADGGHSDLFGSDASTSAPEPGSLHVPLSDRVFRSVAVGSHPDLVTVERTPDERSKRMRKVIAAVDARGIAEFMHLTPAMGGYRIAIVDSVDEMNSEGMNAILKVVEEPPRAAVLILISHAPGRLLATVRSRCRRLALRPLAAEIVATLLERQAPDLPDEERPALVRLSHGSIGRALELLDAGGLDLYRTVVEFFQQSPAINGRSLHDFADRLARNGAEAAYAAAMEQTIDILRRLALLRSAVGERDEVISGETAMMTRLAGSRSLDRWLELWENTRRLVERAESLNLDRKQVVLNVFLALEDGRP
jgi:DNA polymerase-3 subunit delta'